MQDPTVLFAHDNFISVWPLQLKYKAILRPPPKISIRVSIPKNVGLHFAFFFPFLNSPFAPVQQSDDSNSKDSEGNLLLVY